MVYDANPTILYRNGLYSTGHKIPNPLPSSPFSNFYYDGFKLIWYD
jgi:hypothetical protein